MTVIAKTGRCGTRSSRSSVDIESLYSNVASAPMDKEFNHAANDSPRSGSSKQVTPVMWAVIVAVIVVMAIWFAFKS
jgi:hypothetical protein